MGAILGLGAYFAFMGVHDLNRVQTLWSVCDSDGSGAIHYSELVAALDGGPGIVLGRRISMLSKTVPRDY